MAAAGPPLDGRGQVLALDLEDRPGWVVAALVAEVSGLSGTERASIDPEVVLTRYGVDSLGGVWLRHRVEQLFGVQVPVAEFLVRPTVARIAARILVGLAEVPAGVSPLVEIVEFEEGVI